jgi:hypothetical protein
MGKIIVNMTKTDELFGRDVPVQEPAGKPVFVFQGKVMEVDRYSDLGGGVYWLVAEEIPVYGEEEAKEANHG